MAHTNVAVIILLINLIILIAVGIWALRRNNAPPLRPHKFVVNTVPNIIVPQNKKITIINPDKETGEITIDRKKRTLFKGENTVILPKSVKTLNLEWRIGDGPIRRKTINPTSGNYFVIMKDGIFQRAEWAKITPIITISHPEELEGNNYAIRPNILTKSSVNISGDEIENAYKGLPLSINFNGHKNIRASIINPGQPLYLFKNFEVPYSVHPKNPSQLISENIKGILIPYASQDIFTVIANYVPSGGYLHLHVSPYLSLKGNKMYRLYPGINYFTNNNENKWMLITDMQGRLRSQWMPISNYTINN